MSALAFALPFLFAEALEEEALTSEFLPFTASSDKIGCSWSAVLGPTDSVWLSEFYVKRLTKQLVYIYFNNVGTRSLPRQKSR